MQWLLATPVQFWCARRFYIAAAKAAARRHWEHGLAVALGTLAAYGLSLYLWLGAAPPTVPRTRRTFTSRQRRSSSHSCC